MDADDLITIPYHQLGFLSLDNAIKNAEQNGAVRQIALARSLFAEKNGSRCHKCGKQMSENERSTLAFSSTFVEQQQIRQINNVNLWCGECFGFCHFLLKATLANCSFQKHQDWPNVLERISSETNQNATSVTGLVDEKMDELTHNSDQMCVWDLNFLKRRNFFSESFLVFDPDEPHVEEKKRDTKKEGLQAPFSFDDLGVVPLDEEIEIIDGDDSL